MCKPGSMFIHQGDQGVFFVACLQNSFTDALFRYRQLIVEAAQGHLQEALSVGVTWSMLVGGVKAGILLRTIV